METPDHDGALHHAYGILRTLLPGYLRYHAASHTIDDVVPAVDRLISYSGWDSWRASFVRTAAAYHDIGFTVQHERNEPIAARIAGDVLPAYEFQRDQITYIQELIISTQMPQQPIGMGQMLLCDADLDNLGREDFFLLNERLRLELNAQGQSWELRPWLERSLEFLKGHTYHTEAARRLRDEGKQRNINRLERLLAVPATQCDRSGAPLLDHSV